MPLADPVGVFAQSGKLFEFTPLNIISANYFSIISVASMILLTITGWDNLLPGFKIPIEPEVRLKNSGSRIVASSEQ